MESIEKSKTFGNSGKKMTLRDYYDGLPDAYVVSPKKNLLRKISEKCGVPMATARAWMKYGIQPRDKSKIALLAEATGIAPEDMWREN